MVMGGVTRAQRSHPRLFGLLSTTHPEQVRVA
jgi:hypothetical protein